MVSHELPKDTAPSETYEANCHCGWITYAVTLSPPLYDGHEVLNCNCSICTRNGYLLVYPKRDKVEWHGDSLSRVGKYQFNSMKKDHMFCPHCATSLMIDFNGVYENWDVLAINVRNSCPALLVFPIPKA